MPQRAVLRRFVPLSAGQVQYWFTSTLAEIDLPIIMIDDIYFADRVMLVGLGNDAKRNKLVLGFPLGKQDARKRGARAMLADLVECGLDTKTDGSVRLKRIWCRLSGLAAIKIPGQGV